ncbi:hypothetical protein ABT352_38270 [Streptosporangium sp. NPDC000563]|uniref:hypothetical protein n=1 Tax=Streptosporangium sp. NPDC000563 TaxID=3154366 RepID=UPI003330AC45
MTVDAVEEFEQHRSKLFGLAYRMPGSAEEAEDVTVWVDGGGRVGAARRPISGVSKVALPGGVVEHRR